MPRWPAHGKRPGSSGSNVSTTISLSMRPSTSTPSSLFSSTCIACAVLPSVADRPQTGSAARWRAKRSKPCERQLHLHAALGADQFVPLVDDDERDVGEPVAAVGARQHQAQALGRGDQDLGQPLRLARALAGLGVAGADSDRPVEPEVGERLGQCARGVRGERAHRRQPEQAQPASGHLAGKCPVQQSEPDGVGLSGSGRRVQQARASGGDVVPHGALELEGLPAVRREPAFGARQRELSPRAALGRRRGSRRRPGLGSTLFALDARLLRAPRAQLRSDVRARRKAPALLRHAVSR